jgi:hypothetical protein
MDTKPIINSDKNKVVERNTVEEKKYAYLLIPKGSTEWQKTRIIMDKNIAIEMSKKYTNCYLEVYWYNKDDNIYLPLCSNTKI